MIVYRLTRPEYANDLSGLGALLAGGRWNHPGELVLYTAETASLSILEVLVHLNGAVLGVRYDLLTLEITFSEIERVEHLPDTVEGFDEIMACREAGSEWLKKGQTPVLEVPSVLNPLESNYLINPRHPDSQVSIHAREWYLFDGRLVKE